MTTATAPRKTPQQQLACAIEKAQAEGIHILGEGRMKRDNSRFFLVASSDYEQTNKAYVVHLFKHRLSCHCEAGQRGIVCKHRAAVYLHLKEVLETAFDEVERVMQVEHQAETVAAKAERAVLVNHTPESFSIFADTPRERRYQTQEDQANLRDGAPSGEYASHAYR